MNLEADSSPVEPPDETTDLADILVVALWNQKQGTLLNYAQIPHPQQLWDNKYVLF